MPFVLVYASPAVRLGGPSFVLPATRSWCLHRLFAGPRLSLLVYPRSVVLARLYCLPLARCCCQCRCRCRGRRRHRPHWGPTVRSHHWGVPVMVVHAARSPLFASPFALVGVRRSPLLAFVVRPFLRSFARTFVHGRSFARLVLFALVWVRSCSFSPPPVGVFVRAYSRLFGLLCLHQIHS
jgi:hypothetical protein